MRNYLNPQTQEMAKSLIKSVTKEELIDFICSYSSSYTTATAESFLEYIKNKENTAEMYHKTEYTEFVLGVICSWLCEYWRNFEKIATDKLDNYKYRKEQQAKKDADKRRKEKRREKFKKRLIDYYLGRKTEEETRQEMLGNNAPDSRFAKNDLGFKTLAKVTAKLQTKSHSLEKIIKLIDEDIERWYGDRTDLNDEEKQRAEKIERSHGFVNRRG